jgi:hypothetical protein
VNARSERTHAQLRVGKIDALLGAQLGPRRSHDLNREPFRRDGADDSLDLTVVDQHTMVGLHRREQLGEVDADARRLDERTVYVPTRGASRCVTCTQLEEIAGDQANERRVLGQRADASACNDPFASATLDVRSREEVRRAVAPRVDAIVGNLGDGEDAFAATAVAQDELIVDTSGADEITLDRDRQDVEHRRIGGRRRGGRRETHASRLEHATEHIALRLGAHHGYTR